MLGFVALALGRRPVEQVTARRAATPLHACLVGLITENLILSVLVLLVIVLTGSIVGVPLLVLFPFAIVMVTRAILVGFVGLVHQIGGHLTARLVRVKRGDDRAVARGIDAMWD